MVAGGGLDCQMVPENSQKVESPNHPECADLLDQKEFKQPDQISMDITSQN